MYKVADMGLAEEGRKNYEWAYRHMPALVRTIEKLKPKKPLEGVRVGVCLHVTKETSVLVMGLKELGADVYLTCANPLSTQDDIAAFLASEGVNVFAWRGESEEEYWENIRTVLRSRPSILMDDGSDAHVTAHEEGLCDSIVGGTEETTSGVIRLRALDEAGKLRYPIIAVNNAYTKFLFDNRYGTGQSTLDGILRATSLLIAGKKFVVCGYGWVGRGIAMRARGLGADVIVCEVDPYKALEASLDGYSVMPIAEAAKVGDIFVTATGQIGVIRGEHMELMKDGAILANSGHFDVEIDVSYLRKFKSRKVRPNVEEFDLNGKRLYLLAEGRVVNLVAAEGHPPEVMMMSFSNQLMSALYLLENHEKLEKKLYGVPEEIDREVAVNALEGFGIKIDKPTEEQVRYAKSW
ncbi:MAG: adenosylhomocysteinase [Thaumarchaeota archaeon]|nr:adenosylhomocysteinase [Nitrososphaerota archaeon]